MKIGIVGGGQLGQLLGDAAKSLGDQCIFVDPNPDCTASKTGEVLHFNFDDITYIPILADQCDIVTYEFENVDLKILEEIECKTKVYPPIEYLRISQDRHVEKTALNLVGMETANWIEINQESDYEKVPSEIGFPFIVKTRRFGYDGKGQFAIYNEDEFAAKKSSLPKEGAIAEQMIPFDFEVSKIASRSVDGEIVFYPLTKNTHSEGILRTSCAPLYYSTYNTLDQLASKHCKNFMEKYSYVGTMTIEFFAIGDRLIANEFAPRVHNSGHWTLDAGISSQFENHIRALTGRTLGPTHPAEYVGMVNIIGKQPTHSEINKIPDTIVYDYGKQPRPGRKLGHINTRADSYPELIKKITNISTYL